VHYNSPKPAAVQAHAYAHGTDIHLGPGQQQHLPHEAWHVVQQKQGRVKPTLQMKGVAINDDRALESEADRMGARAWSSPHSIFGTESVSYDSRPGAARSESIVQRYTEKNGKLVSENGKYMTKTGGAPYVYVKPGAPIKNSVKRSSSDEKGYEKWGPAFKVIPDCVNAAEELMHETPLKVGIPAASKFRPKNDDKDAKGPLPFGAKANKPGEKENKKFGKKTDMGAQANPSPGNAYVIIRQEEMSTETECYPYHGAAVVATDGRDNVTLETVAKATNKRQVPVYKMYGHKTLQSFKEKWGPWFGKGPSVSVLEPNLGSPVPTKFKNPTGSKNVVVDYEDEKGGAKPKPATTSNATTSLPSISNPPAAAHKTGVSEYTASFSPPHRARPVNRRPRAGNATSVAGSATSGAGNATSGGGDSKLVLPSLARTGVSEYTANFSPRRTRAQAAKNNAKPGQTQNPVNVGTAINNPSDTKK
jgi:hypothetical protein